MGLNVLNWRSLRTKEDVVVVETPSRAETEDSAILRLASLRCFLTAVRRSFRVSRAGANVSELGEGAGGGVLTTCDVEDTECSDR